MIDFEELEARRRARDRRRRARGRRRRAIAVLTLVAAAAAVVAAVKAAGYRGSTTVVPGWARRSSDPYRLPRLRVVAGTSPAALLAQIAAVRSAAPAPRRYA